MLKILFDYVSLWEMFDITCVWFASHSIHLNTGQYFQLLKKKERNH